MGRGETDGVRALAVCGCSFGDEQIAIKGSNDGCTWHNAALLMHHRLCLPGAEAPYNCRVEERRLRAPPDLIRGNGDASRVGFLHN